MRPASEGGGSGGSAAAFRMSRYAGRTPPGVYSGASTSVPTSTSATTRPPSITRAMRSLVTRPMTDASMSQRSKISRTGASRPSLTMSNIRSCDSESMTS